MGQPGVAREDNLPDDPTWSCGDGGAGDSYVLSLLDTLPL